MQTFLQGCFIKCEILQSPMISYRSLLFIATAMNDLNLSNILATWYMNTLKHIKLKTITDALVMTA